MMFSSPGAGLEPAFHCEKRKIAAKSRIVETKKSGLGCICCSKALKRSYSRTESAG
jgi:hypothetical protein